MPIGASHDLLDHVWTDKCSADADETVEGDDKVTVAVTVDALEGACHAFEGTADDLDASPRLEILAEYEFGISLLIKADESLHLLIGDDNLMSCLCVCLGTDVLDVFPLVLELLQQGRAGIGEEEAMDGRHLYPSRFLGDSIAYLGHNHGYEHSESGLFHLLLCQ